MLEVREWMFFNVKWAILIPSQPVFTFTSKRYILSGETANTNFIVCGLTRPLLEHTMYCTEGDHANTYNIDEVPGKVYGD
jgi:hypothetical protein